VKKSRFEIESVVLSTVKTKELERMALFLHMAGEVVGDADICSSDEAPDKLKDLGDALTEELLSMGAVVMRIEKRIAKELAKRK
jgi:hypothetical protein